MQEVRLRSGALVSEGRVELRNRNTWSTICDDQWTLKEANVVCRSLGYGSAAIAAKNAYFGRGIGEVKRKIGYI
ncbi:Lysyl oxidase-like 2a [Desmophyllum pertusum]|uniref:Lysyl oxidase-like 2a n=1 Tax=Desmophyllum pertusum TaxID=174260 RepID=A0A9X0DB87_9CNID|nr:Lysyl oxidase-like 2a [Desmophyllum pertusum]